MSSSELNNLFHAKKDRILSRVEPRKSFILTLLYIMVITVSRVYDQPIPDKGYRVLVDRLWPRGISKEKLKLDAWMKDIAPSDELRKWFSHDPKKWNDFKIRYFKELDKNPKTKELLKICRNRDVIFLYSTKTEETNNAVALKLYVEEKLKDQGKKK